MENVIIIALEIACFVMALVALVTLIDATIKAVSFALYVAGLLGEAMLYVANASAEWIGYHVGNLLFQREYVLRERLARVIDAKRVAEMDLVYANTRLDCALEVIDSLKAQLEQVKTEPLNYDTVAYALGDEVHPY